MPHSRNVFVSMICDEAARPELREFSGSFGVGGGGVVHLCPWTGYVLH